VTPEPVAAWIALGANLGDAPATLRRALVALDATPGIALVRCSSFYRSAPVDAAGPDFFNAVAQVSTTLDAHALLAALQAIESAEGRERPYRNAPRTLDLDLLIFGDRTIETPSLVVPHPRMNERAFVLRPLAEIAPARVSPQQLQAVAAQRIERVPGGENGSVSP
jgi:2-amino-4-hydroxy-6-hydroxymethyldihydropteridine diphosphokinase